MQDYYYKIVPSLKMKNIVEHNEKLYYVKRSQSEKLIGYSQFTNMEKELNTPRARWWRNGSKKVERQGKVLVLEPVSLPDYFKVDLNPLTEKIFSKIQVFEIVRVLNKQETKEYSALA